jgi:hypothetical protein
MTIRYATTSTDKQRGSAVLTDAEERKLYDEAARLLRTVPPGTHYVTWQDGKPVLRAGAYRPRTSYVSPWGEREAREWASSRPRPRSSWGSATSTTKKRASASAEPLPPLGFVILHGAGNVEGNTSGRLRACSAEYAAPGCFDESVRAIEEGKKRFQLKLHHGGPVLGDTTKGNLKIDARWGATPVAIWEPDSNDIEHRGIVARAIAGSLKCSAEFRCLADNVADGVRRLDRVELQSVCLLRADEVPAYSACIVAPLDRFDMTRSLLRLRGRAIMTDKGEA